MYQFPIAIFGGLSKMPTDTRTDTPSYRDARTYLKRRFSLRGLDKNILFLCIFDASRDDVYSELSLTSSWSLSNFIVIVVASKTVRTTHSLICIKYNIVVFTQRQFPWKE